MTPSLTDPSVRLHAAVVSAWVAGCRRVGTVRARSGRDRARAWCRPPSWSDHGGIGALMWVGFSDGTDIEDKTNDKISEVGT